MRLIKPVIHSFTHSFIQVRVRSVVACRAQLGPVHARPASNTQQSDRQRVRLYLAQEPETQQKALTFSAISGFSFSTTVQGLKKKSRGKNNAGLCRRHGKPAGCQP